MAILPPLFFGHRDLGLPTGFQSDMAKIFSIRTFGMAVAMSHVSENPALLEEKRKADDFGKGSLT
jgi:hypothetical protein